MIDFAVKIAIWLAAGLIIGEFIQRVGALLPDRVSRPAIRAREWYLDLFRARTPNHVYKLWYRTGIMDAESYREFQRRGHITDDLDPEYLQRDD